MGVPQQLDTWFSSHKLFQCPWAHLRHFFDVLALKKIGDIKRIISESHSHWLRPGNQGSEVYLVGGWATPLKNMKVNWDDDIPNIWENKKCSKPPTSYGWFQLMSDWTPSKKMGIEASKLWKFRMLYRQKQKAININKPIQMGWNPC